jgi:hypothetical protein
MATRKKAKRASQPRDDGPGPHQAQIKKKAKSKSAKKAK